MGSGAGGGTIVGDHLMLSKGVGEGDSAGLRPRRRLESRGLRGMEPGAWLDGIAY